MFPTSFDLPLAFRFPLQQPANAHFPYPFSRNPFHTVSSIQFFHFFNESVYLFDESVHLFLEFVCGFIGSIHCIIGSIYCFIGPIYSFIGSLILFQRIRLIWVETRSNDVRTIVLSGPQRSKKKTPTNRPNSICEFFAKIRNRYRARSKRKSWHSSNINCFA